MAGKKFANQSMISIRQWIRRLHRYFIFYAKRPRDNPRDLSFHRFQRRNSESTNSSALVMDLYRKFLASIVQRARVTSGLSIDVTPCYDRFDEERVKLLADTRSIKHPRDEYTREATEERVRL